MTGKHVHYASMLLLICLLPAMGRSEPQSDSALFRLQSALPMERAEAFLELRGTPDGLALPAVAGLLVDVLIRENQLWDTILRESNGTESVGNRYGEGYGSYYLELMNAVDRIADKEEPRVVEAIAGSTYTTTWETALLLATRYTERVLPVILEKVSSDLSFRRYEGIRMLSLVAENASASNLAPADAASILSTIRAAVDDQNHSPRLAAVGALGRIGGLEDLPLLEQIAAEDESELIRVRAGESISNIRRRNPPRHQ